MPAAKKLCIGVWECGIFIGVLLFSTGSGHATNGTKIGAARKFEVAELQRVALASHVTQVTRIVRIAMRLLKKRCDGLRAIVSFADPSEGHHGGIYQGGNWVYCGVSASVRELELSDGRWVHNRTVGRQWGRHGKASRIKTGNSRIRSGKHKYYFPLDDAMRAQLEPLRKPYPKRAASVASDTAANHAAEGGATPTAALLTKRVV